MAKVPKLNGQQEMLMVFDSEKTARNLESNSSRIERSNNQSTRLTREQIEESRDNLVKQLEKFGV